MKSTLKYLAAAALGSLLTVGVILAQPESRPVPDLVNVGINCDTEAVRLYGINDGQEAASACEVVEVHAVPKTPARR